MKRSTDRILTTHTGSLPRPPSSSSLLTAQEAGAVDDRAGLDAAVRTRCGKIVSSRLGRASTW